MNKNNKRCSLYLWVVVLKDAFRNEINFDLRIENTYLEFWSISLQNDLLKYYLQINALNLIFLRRVFKWFLQLL